jgi:hypothetical protein
MTQIDAWRMVRKRALAAGIMGADRQSLVSGDRDHGVSRQRSRREHFYDRRANLITGKKESVLTNTAAWRSLADRLIAKSKTIFDTSSVMESTKGAKDPKVWALALLARTIGNIESALIVLDSGHVVEARTLVRCCYENFFCSAAIVRTGDEFIKTMELDNAASKKKQAKGLLDWADKQDQDIEFAEKLSTFAKALDKKRPKASFLNHKKTADTGTVQDAYVFYNVLSNDSAHPSATSLSRHITWDGEGEDAEWTISAFPTDEPGEVNNTLELVCTAVLGVCVAVNETVGGTESGERLWTLGDECRALSSVSKAERDKV